MLDVEKIRGDFPILSRTVYGKPLVYLDSAATSQKPRRVIDCERRLYEEENANVHRGVHYLSGRMTELFEEARERVRSFIGASSREEIVFTSGATAAVNAVAYSYGELAFGPGDNIVVSEMEHHSNIVPWQLVCGRRGVEIRVLPFDDEGRLMVERLPELLDERTKLVAVTQASNVLGTMPRLQEVVAAAHAAGAVVLVDGCQGVVHGGVDVEALGCDFYVFSGHKLYAPNGIGVLYGRRELLERMPPFLGGGDMVKRVRFSGTTFADVPLKFEAGTANYIGAVCLGEAIEYIRSIGIPEMTAHERLLAEYAAGALSAVEGVRIYGTASDKCSILSFNAEGVHAYDMGMILDKLGIAVRTGAHCADPVMQHYGVKGMVRASFAFYNTMPEADAFVAGVQRAVRMLR
jgi:cysteine desulfurase/selenocysteine lyase